MKWALSLFMKWVCPHQMCMSEQQVIMICLCVELNFTNVNKVMLNCDGVHDISSKDGWLCTLQHCSFCHRYCFGWALTMENKSKYILETILITISENVGESRAWRKGALWLCLFCHFELEAVICPKRHQSAGYVTWNYPQSPSALPST